VLTIGVSSFNQGHFVQDLPEILVAYPLRPFEQASKMAKNGGVSLDRKKRREFRKKSENYVRTHNRFWYAVINEASGESRFDERVLAISRLAAKASEEFDPFPETGLEVIVKGHPFGNGSGFSHLSLEAIPKKLSEVGLDARFSFYSERKKTSDEEQAIYVADRLAYIVGGLKFGLPEKEWPLNGRKLDVFSEPLDPREVLLIESMLDTGYKATG
jgi:hypothetical protein